MQYYERMYLLEEAWYLWEQTLAAEEEGDVFVARETFTKLSNNTSAKARITRPEPEEPPVLALIVRGDSEDAIVATAWAFFDKGFDFTFKIREGEVGFVAKYVPPKLRPPVQDSGGNT